MSERRKSTTALILGMVTVLACVSAMRAEVVIETVVVGNPGNDGELSGGGAGGYGPDHICGAVDYVYAIGKYEVTAGQYTEFLNAVAAVDTYGLYNTEMWHDNLGCQIERTGSQGNYSYGVALDWADRPVNYVSWGDAARFANWLHNGQPTGQLTGDPAQDAGLTEDGSYYLCGAVSGIGLARVIRKPIATWAIPFEDEWYKAAYHKNDGVTGNYWDYPTGSDTLPASEPPPGADTTNGSANYFVLLGEGPQADWAIGPPYYKTEVGAYDAKPSDSPYGTFDQGGNVWEWNETTLYDWNLVLRGGAFIGGDVDGYVFLHAATRSWFGTEPTCECCSVGFRLIKFFEPPPEPEDVDRDGDVDLRDYALLQAALTGPR